MEMHTRASLREVHGFDGSARAPFRLGAWLSGVFKRMRDAQRRRRDYLILMEKTDRELSDIGLTRAEVAYAYRRGGRLTRRSTRG